MPNVPSSAKLNASSVDILNAIRNSATANYQDYVPVADNSLDSIREIGAIMMNYPALQNEFLSALVNRIGRVIISSKMYTNPWAMFKKGLLEYGETIEEIFVNIAKPFEYDAEVSESEVFKREMPDVRAAFHILNYKKFYKTTIQQEQLRQAFLSWDGITNLISKITDSLYTGANYDEFMTMKYLIAKHILAGNIKAVTVSTVNATNAKAITSTIKGVSNNMEFMNRDYNKAGVHTYSMKDEQYLIVNSAFDAIMDVEVLASAFNMSKAEFDGHHVLVDGFGNLDTSRLAELFANDDSYVELTSAQLTALNAIPAVLVDKNWFMILDNMMNFTEQYNGQGLYWNYWYHVWKTFSISPFSNAALFVPGTPSITSVTVSPDAVTVSAGQSVNLSAVVVTENFAPQTVVWSSSDEDVATVDIYGTVTISADAEEEDTATITATSAFDSTKTDTCTITVA